MKATGLNDPFPARPDDPDERLAITQNAGPRLSYVVGRLDRLLRRRLSVAVEPIGLTLPAYTALSVLRVNDGLSNAHLARLSLVTPQSMSEVLAQLVDRGYVRRRAEPGNGRVIRTELTTAGSRALELCDRAVDEVEREMLRGLETDEVTNLHASLLRCGRTLEHDRAVSPAP